MPFRLISRQAQMVKSYYSGIGKTAVTCVAAFLVSTALGTIGLGMVFYLRDVFNATGGQVGAFFGLYSLTYIAGCLLFRPLTDSIRPRYLLIISTLSIFLCTTAILYCGSFALACVFYALTGAACALFWPPLMGWLSGRLQNAELSRTISRFNMAWSIGAIVSPYMAGWLSEKQTALPIQLGAGLALLTSFLILGATLTLPKVRNDQDSLRPDPQDAAEAGEATRLRYAAWIGVFATCVVIGVMVNIFPLSARDGLHLSKRAIGMLLLSRTLFTAVGFAVMGRTVFWHYKGSQMLFGQFCIIGALVAMICLYRPAIIGLAMPVFGLMFALNYFNSLFHGMVGSANRVGRSAIHEALGHFGLITGSVVGGFIYQHFSIREVYAFCIATVLGGIVIQTAIIVWARKRETHSRMGLEKGAAHDDG